MELTPQRPILPILGGPSWFEKDWPDTPYHRVGSAAVLKPALTWAAIDTLLNDQGIQAPAFRMAQDNKLVPLPSITRSEGATSQAVKGLADPVRVVSELGSGATLVLQGLQRLWPPLSDICRRLGAEVGHAVFVNAYLTPRAERGFGVHHDPYHAWLVQVAGAKTWRLWAPGSDPATEEPDREVLLAEGDVLWIPRGWWHAGSSGDRPSLHLTFTVWATKLDDILRAALAELMQRNDFSQELPPHCLRDPSRAEATIADATAELTRMVARLAPGALQERLMDRQRERHVPLPATPIAVVLGADRPERLHAHPEGVLYITPDDSGIRIRTADTTVKVAPELESDCWALLGRTGSFTVDELGPEWTDRGEDLLARLREARLICTAACEPDGARRIS